MWPRTRAQWTVFTRGSGDLWPQEVSVIPKSGDAGGAVWWVKVTRSWSCPAGVSRPRTAGVRGHTQRMWRLFTRGLVIMVLRLECHTPEVGGSQSPEVSESRRQRSPGVATCPQHTLLHRHGRDWMLGLSGPAPLLVRARGP